MSPAPAPAGAPTASNTGATSTRAWPPAARRGLAAIAGVVVLTGILGGIAFPILPQVGSEAGLASAWVGLLLAANRIGRMLSSPYVGRTVDRIGGRAVLMAGATAQLGVVALYLWGVQSQHPGYVLMLGRVLHGPASACVFVSSQTLALRLGGAGARARATGVIAAAQAAGVPIGLVVGGLAGGFFGSATTFAGAGLLPILGLAAAWRWAPDHRQAAGSPSWPSPQTQPSQPSQPAQPSKSPRTSRALLTSPRLLTLCLLACLTNLSANGVVLACLAPLVRARDMCPPGLPPMSCTSLFMMALVGGTLLATPPASRLADRRRGRSWVAGSAAALMLLGLWWVRGATSPAMLVAGSALVGGANGTLNVVIYAFLGDWVPPARRGRGVALLQLFADIGGSIGPPMGTWLMAQSQTLPFSVTFVTSLLLLPLAWQLARAERAARQPRAGAHAHRLTESTHT